MYESFFLWREGNKDLGEGIGRKGRFDGGGRGACFILRLVFVSEGGLFVGLG